MFKLDIFAVIALLLICLIVVGLIFLTYSLINPRSLLIISDADATQIFMKEAGTTQVSVDQETLGNDLIVYKLHIDGKPAQGMCIKAPYMADVNCTLFVAWSTATPKPQ